MGSFRFHSREGGTEGKREYTLPGLRKDCGSVFSGNRAARQRGRQDQLTRLDLVAV